MIDRSELQLRYKADYWDKRLSIATTLYFVGGVFNATVKSVLPIPQSLWGLISALVGVIIIGGYAVCFKEMLRRSRTLFWKSVTFFLVLYFISIIICTIHGTPIDVMLRHSALLTFVWWIPTGLFACSVFNYKILYNTWVKASYIVSLFCVILYFFHIPSAEDGSAEYNMMYGFFVILPLLIQIFEIKREFKKWLLLLILFEIFTIVVYANRGVLLSLIFFVVYLFAFEHGSRIKKIVALLFLVLMGVILSTSIETLASVLVEMLDSIGFQSRSLYLLASGMIDDTSGRDEIWKICFKMIEEAPVLGWGLGGEYYHIAYNLEKTASIDTISAYTPHNGIIQNWVNFGIFLGTIASLILVTPFFFFGKIKDKMLKALIIIFFSTRIVPCLISASGFFIEPQVAIFFYLYYFNTNRRTIFINYGINQIFTPYRRVVKANKNL